MWLNSSFSLIEEKAIGPNGYIKHCFKLLKLRQVPVECALYGSLLDANIHDAFTQGVVYFA